MVMQGRMISIHWQKRRCKILYRNAQGCVMKYTAYENGWDSTVAQPIVHNVNMVKMPVVFEVNAKSGRAENVTLDFSRNITTDLHAETMAVLENLRKKWEYPHYQIVNLNEPHFGVYNVTFDFGLIKPVILLTWQSDVDVLDQMLHRIAFNS